MPNKLDIDLAGDAIFLTIDGLRIAKRGQAGSRHAGTWISLEPGYTVRDCFNEKGEMVDIEVEFSRRRARVH